MNKRFSCIVVLGIVMYFSNLGGTSIYILDESKNAGCAMEMLQRGDVIVPTFNGALRTDKPPLHYYFMMASYQFFGVTSFAARFFSALCGVLTLIVVYINVRKLVDERAAFFSSLVLLSSAQLTIQFHLAVPDPYLILLMTVCLFSFFNGFHHNPASLKWFYGAAALGFLTKGLIAVVLPGLIIVVYLLLLKRLTWNTIRHLQIIRGLIIFCMIALPWYVLVGIETDGMWLKGFFIEHNVGRYTSTMEGHRGFLFSPFVILLVALLPFSVFIVQAIRLTFSVRKDIPILLFSFVVAVVFAGFFSFSRTILPSYPAPAIPFLAVPLGYFLSRLGMDNFLMPKGMTVSLLINLFLSILIGVAAYIALSFDPQLNDIRHIALIFLVLPVGSAAGWYFFNKRRPELMSYALSASWMLLIVMFFYLAYPRLDERNPVKETIPVITGSYGSHRILGYRLFNPSYVFNLGKVVEGFESPEQIKALTDKQEKILVITRAEYLNELPTNLTIVYRGKDLFETSETVLLTN